MSDEAPENWRLLLRYGRLQTPYSHYTVLADVVVTEVDDEPGSHVGPAWLAMKVWTESSDAAMDLVRAIAPQLGADVRGRVEVYDSEPEEPPQDRPFAYDPHFTGYTR